MRKREPLILGKRYDHKAFYWAVLYQPHGTKAKPQITIIYPRGTDARKQARHANREWKENGWQPAWSVKRFVFYFKGAEIDAYEHIRTMEEKQPSRK